MRVILVAGPPCSGKTTYVQEHRQPGDIVLDQDEIGPAAMRAGIAALASRGQGTAWVIRCAPGSQAREQLARELNADDVVLLTPSVDELIERAKDRRNVTGTIKAIREWHRIERQPATLSVDPASI